MRSAENVIRILTEQGRPVRLKELASLGIHSQTMCNLVRDGAVEKLGLGIYQITGAPSHPLALYAQAALSMPNALFSEMTAAWLHGFIDDEPNEISLTKPREKSPMRQREHTIQGHRVIDHILKSEHMQEWSSVSYKDIEIRFFPPELTCVSFLRHERAQKTGNMDISQQVIKAALDSGADPAKMLRWCQILKVSVPAMRKLIAGAGHHA